MTSTNSTSLTCYAWSWNLVVRFINVRRCVDDIYVPAVLEFEDLMYSSSKNIPGVSILGTLANSTSLMDCAVSHFVFYLSNLDIQVYLTLRSNSWWKISTCALGCRRELHSRQHHKSRRRVIKAQVDRFSGVVTS